MIFYNIISPDKHVLFALLGPISKDKSILQLKQNSKYQLYTYQGPNNSKQVVRKKPHKDPFLYKRKKRERGKKKIKRNAFDDDDGDDACGHPIESTE